MTVRSTGRRHRPARVSGSHQAGPPSLRDGTAAHGQYRQRAALEKERYGEGSPAPVRVVRGRFAPVCADETIRDLGLSA